MTETIRYALIGLEDLAAGTSSYEVTLADGRVVILSQISLVRLPTGLTAASIPFVGSDGKLTEDTTNLTFADSTNVLSVASIKLLAAGTFRAVDANAQLIHAFGTTT